MRKSENNSSSTTNQAVIRVLVQEATFDFSDAAQAQRFGELLRSNSANLYRHFAEQEGWQPGLGSRVVAQVLTPEGEPHPDIPAFNLKVLDAKDTPNPRPKKDKPAGTTPPVVEEDTPPAE